MSSKLIIVVTTEPPPVPGSSTTGAGLRAWGLAMGLAANDFQALLLCEKSITGDNKAQCHEGIEVDYFSRPELTKILNEKNPSAIVLQHWGLMNCIGELSVPIAIDLAGPHLLERLYWGAPDIEQDRMEKLEALRRADFVTCSGDLQRLYFMPYLQSAGWDITQETIAPVIPFSIDPNLPPAKKRDPEKIVYGGYFLPWQDPSLPIRACLEAMDEAGKGTLEFVGGVHPQLDVSAGKFEDLMKFLEEHPRVNIHGTKSWDELIELYSGCGIALDLMAKNLERELAFTTRTVVYLWCGLPVIYNSYSELSQYIETYDAGWTLEPHDYMQIKSVILGYLDNPESQKEMSENAQNLVDENLDWSWTAGRLVDWCKEPTFRPEKEESLKATGEFVRIMLDRKEKELAEVRSELHTLQGKWFVRLSQRLNKFAPLLAPFVFLITWPLSRILAKKLDIGSPTTKQS